VGACVEGVDRGALDPARPPGGIAGAAARFAGSCTFPLRKRGRSGDRSVDARRFVASLVQAAPRRLLLELSIGPEGTIRPGALVGELLSLSSDAVATLPVHKRGTRLRASAAAAA